MSLYLFKRNSTYYYRIKIPVALREHFSGKELIVKSLKTKDLSAAKVSASHINKQVQQSFALLRVHQHDFQLIQHPIIATGLRQENLQVTTRQSMKLSELIEKYISEKSANWTERTTDDFRGKYKTLLKIVSDRPIVSIDRETCIQCRDTLLQLPSNFTKKKAFKGKSISQLTSIKGAQKLSIKTVNMYLIQLSSVFKWAVKYGHLELNPAEGLQIQNKSKKKSEERKAYTTNDIEKIFNALPYSSECPESY